MPRTARHRRRAGVPAPAAIVALGAPLLLAGWPACTVTKDNYKALSFWFDGVPDPNAPNAVVDPVTGEIRSYVSLSVHDPFAREQCDECHRGRLRLSRADSDPCLRCHEGIATEHAYTHGPVAAGACLWCHDPHESARPHLLRDADRALCTQCHAPELLDVHRVPAHADPDRACLECHTGHGGPRPYLLRADVPEPAPPPGREK